jgi:hypothetical protein
MAVPKFYVGTELAFATRYANPDTWADLIPSTISCVVTLPDGSHVAPITWSGADTSSAEKIIDAEDAAQIEFRFYYTTTVAGTHHYTITAAGTGTVVQYGSFVILATP